MEEVKKEEHMILNYILEEVNEELLEHISFKKELINLLKFIYATVDSDSPIIPYISKDKREISLSNTGKVNNKDIDLENKLVVRGSIIIENDGSLTTNKISGIVYKEEDKSTLYTYYSQEHLNRFGVSLSRTTFTDEFKLDEDINTVPIKEYVFSTIHRPLMYFGKLFSLPQKYMNGGVSYVYRDYREPGVIYVENTTNLRENRRLLSESTKKMYLSDPKSPKSLDFVLTPIAVFDDITKDYQTLKNNN